MILECYQKGKRKPYNSVEDLQDNRDDKTYCIFHKISCLKVCDHCIGRIQNNDCNGPYHEVTAITKMYLAIGPNKVRWLRSS